MESAHARAVPHFTLVDHIFSSSTRRGQARDWSNWSEPSRPSFSLASTRLERAQDCSAPQLFSTAHCAIVSVSGCSGKLSKPALRPFETVRCFELESPRLFLLARDACITCYLYKHINRAYQNRHVRIANANGRRSLGTRLAFFLELAPRRRKVPDSTSTRLPKKLQ